MGQGFTNTFFSPLISPKETQIHEQFSPQSLGTEEVFGEPHYKKIKDGMIIRRSHSPSRYIVSLACGQLQKPRYVNEKIEEELKEFKLEIK